MHAAAIRASASTMLGGFALILVAWFATSHGEAGKSTIGPFDEDMAHLGINIGTPFLADVRTSHRLRSSSRRLQTGSRNNILLAFFSALRNFWRNLLGLQSRSASCPAPNKVPPLPGKKGIGFTMRADGQIGSATENLPKVKALSVSWNYSWGTNRPSGQPDGVEFVPMIYGGYEKTIEDTVRQVRTDFAAGRTKRLLGFNEPDSVTQSNISVERAVGLWKSLEGSGMPLVSPSAVQPTGQWMQAFMNNTETSCLRMEWLGVHWYGGPNADAFKQKMLEVYNMYGRKRPLLITEFAPADWTTGGDPLRNRWTEKMVLDFAKEVLPWLEQQAFIAGYAWFPFAITSPQGHTSALFQLDGQLSTLGRYYASVTPDNIYGDQSIDLED